MWWLLGSCSRDGQLSSRRQCSTWAGVPIRCRNFAALVLPGSVECDSVAIASPDRDLLMGVVYHWAGDGLHGAEALWGLAGCVKLQL
jgi:hypothetical protein